VRDGTRIIVSGFGGIGKTVFCKYLFCSVFRNPAGKIPVFFELRKISEITEKNIYAYLRISLTAEAEPLPEDVFKAMMRDGRFLFILDGFDEIPDEFKNDIQKQIIEISHLYRGCGIVISSRLDERFASWQEFHVYRALPFDKEQARQVIDKIEFETETKKEFIVNILEKRYETYKPFLSTPLLTLMMLMTYLQIRHIPDNVHIFYRYAFQTLFTLHDASKEGFQRKRRLNLSEQEFLEVFSIFCLSSYVDMRYSFTEAACIEYIDKAKKRTGKSFSAIDFLSDATDAVNMLFKDGDQYTFIHRSFQEYFTAYAITHYFVKPIREVMPRLPRRPGDAVFSMMRTMNESVIDEFYLIPEYKELEQIYILYQRTTDPLEILKLLDYKMDLGVAIQGRKTSPNMYYTYSSSKIEAFVSIVYMMFKEKAPEEIKIDVLDTAVVKSLTNFGRIVRPEIKGKEVVVDSHIDFLSESIRFVGRNLADSSVEVRYEKSFAEIDVLKEFPIVPILSSQLKARSVFVKRLLDEMRRSHRRARDTSDDILSL